MQFSEVDSAPLVPRFDVAHDPTRNANADGQVLVCPYETLNRAGIGLSRLRSLAVHGAILQCNEIGKDGEQRTRKSFSTLLESVSGSLPLN